MSENKSDWQAAVDLREEVQNEEREARLGAIEEAHFNADKDGHWEEYAKKRFEGKPTFQVDLVKPIIDSIAGEIEQKEIGGQVIPVGGDATTEIANTYQRMIRTISNMSDAARIYSAAARNITDHAYDAWMCKTDYSDVDSFDQDLMIEPIPDSVNRVWLVGVCSAVRPEDIPGGFVDTALSKKEYREKFPEGSCSSLGDFGHDSRTSNESGNTDSIIVSDYYYIKHESTVLHLLSDNRVVSDEQYQPVAAELRAKGIVAVKQKARKLPKCYVRKMDGGGWLTEEKETVFRYVPIFQVMANFQILNKKPYYRGETRKLMDPQRIYDYGTTKDVNDGALGRKDKIAASVEQVEGHEAQNARLNSADEPLFIYSPDSQSNPPYILQGAQVDVGLQSTTAKAQMDMKEISMSHNPQQGAGLSGHSGEAYKVLNEKSNTSANKYIAPVEKAVSWTYKVIIDAIPRVYDTKNRQVRLTNEDGTSTFEMVNEEVQQPDGSIQVVNDLAQGSYMFKVEAGEAFTSRRSEGIQAIKEWATIDPTIVQEGGDLILKALNAPIISDIADRVRKRKIAEGIVPEDQLTDEEKEKIAAEIQAQQEAQQPDPMEQATVQAVMAEAQRLMAQTEEINSKMQIAQAEQERKFIETMSKIERENKKLDSEIDNKDADTLNKLREASGADAIVSPDVAEAYSDVAEGMTE
jgi:hypothetical protein